MPSTHCSGMSVTVIRRHPDHGPGYAWAPPPIYRVTFDSIDTFAQVYGQQIRHQRLTMQAKAVVGLGGNIRVELCVPTRDEKTTITVPGCVVSSRPALDFLEEEVGIELLINHDSRRQFRALLENLDPEERREWRRRAFTGAVHVHTLQMAATGRGVDLSEGGIAVSALPMLPNPASRIELLIPLPDGRPAFKTHAAIVWARRAAFGNSHVAGLEFEPLAQRTRERIQEWANDGL